MSAVEAPPAALRRAAWLLAAALLSALFATLHFGTAYQYIPVDALVEFTAPDPFQRRVLAPALAAGLGLVLDAPPATRAFLVEIGAWGGLIAAAWWALGAIAPHLGRDTRRLVALTVLIPVGSQLILPSRFRVFLGETPVGDVHGLLGPFTRVTALSGLFFPYDVPAAALLLALLASLAALAERPDVRRWSVFAGLFLIAAANRETVVLLVPLTLWTLRGRLYGAALAATGALQVAGAAIVIGLLGWVVDAPPNPRSSHAGGVEWYLWTNLRTLAHPLYAVCALLPLAAGAWVPPLVNWRRLPDSARALVTLYVVPAFAVALTFGIVLETRVFTEVAAALWLAAAAALLAPEGRRV